VKEDGAGVLSISQVAKSEFGLGRSSDKKDEDDKQKQHMWPGMSGSAGPRLAG
jgi:hypothetical protein